MSCGVIAFISGMLCGMGIGVIICVCIFDKMNQ